jgi:putative toxin-antitoxin system antitoxin component (TIGR02293 family)
MASTTTRTKKAAPVKVRSKNSISSANTAVRFAEIRSGRKVGRVTATRFKNMLRTSPLKEADWAHTVHEEPRVFSVRLKENRGFDPLQSDRIVLIEQVLDHGVEVFGDAKKFRRWLEEPRPMLSGKKPIDLLSDMVGIGQVMAELGRIEHGVF